MNCGWNVACKSANVIHERAYDLLVNLVRASYLYFLSRSF